MIYYDVANPYLVYIRALVPLPSAFYPLLLSSHLSIMISLPYYLLYPRALPAFGPVFVRV